MEPPTRSGPRACRACAISKAKCHFLEDPTATNGKCRRCNRLNKECLMQTPTPRVREPHRQSRVAQLEQKLDGLVTLLKASPGALDSQISLQGFGELNLQDGATGSSGKPSPPKSVAESESSLLDDPDYLYSLYCDHIARSFPFVVIPQDFSLDSLQKQKPFLSKVVLMVASCRDPRGQLLLSKEIMRYVSDHVVLQAERNLDLLQGILLFIAWNHYHVHDSPIPHLIVLLNLAIAISVDLNLNREPAEVTSSKTPNGMMKTYTRVALNQDPRTVEERRTYLGLIYLSSFVSVYVAEIDPLRWSSYAAECFRIIQDNGEFASDQYLLALVGLQKLNSEIRGTLRLENLHGHSNVTLISEYIRQLRTKLDDFIRHLPFELSTNPALLLHYYSVLVYLTETAFFIPLPSRTATLQACLFATRSYLTTLFAVPALEYYKLFYPVWIQMLHTLGVLAKLSQLESDDWDISHVQAVLDMGLVLDGLIERFKMLQTGQPTASRMFVVTIPRLQRFKEDFEKKRQEIMFRKAVNDQILQELVLEPQQEVLWNQLDEGFWQEIMADWEGNPVS